MDVPGAMEPWTGNLSPITRHLTPLAYNHVHLHGLLAEHFAAAGNQERAREQGGMILLALSRFGPELEQNALVVVEADRIRVRMPDGDSA